MNAPLGNWPLPPFRMSVAQYHALRDHNILGEDDPVELLRGILVQKMTKKPPHSACTELARVLITALLPLGWHVRGQEPITFPDSEPEPDGAVVRGHQRDYLGRHPVPADVALIIEVSDTSLDVDQGTKKEIYASAGVPVYWIVNLVDHRLEVYTAPQGDDYASRTDLGPGDRVAVVIAGQAVGSIAVSDLLP
jgi:Uma2 family endonuclease